MVLVAWMVFAIVVIYLICSCIKFCVKQVTKDKPVQIKTLVKAPATNKEKIIKELFGNNIELFTKFNGISFWVYSDIYGYFYSATIQTTVKNKIAKKVATLKKQNPNITDYFVPMTMVQGSVEWDYEPIDFSNYTPPKSKKDECIDELNELIGDKK